MNSLSLTCTMKTIPLLKGPAIAFGYIRVSTDRQDLSVEAQTEQVKRAADYHALADYELFAEPDTSGSLPFAERPQARRLLAAAKLAASQGRGVTLIVPKVDRMGRNVVDIDTTVNRFEALGARILFLDINVD